MHREQLLDYISAAAGHIAHNSMLEMVATVYS